VAYGRYINKRKISNLIALKIVTVVYERFKIYGFDLKTPVILLKNWSLRKGVVYERRSQPEV